LNKVESPRLVVAGETKINVEYIYEKNSQTCVHKNKRTLNSFYLFICYTTPQASSKALQSLAHVRAAERG